MIVKSSIIILLAGFSFCNPKPPDPPDPPEPECLPNVKWCQDVGQTCSTPEVKCKHNPTSDPNHCELAPACPVEPIPEPICKEGQNCNCYKYVEVMDNYHLMTCSDPQKCKDFVCTTPEIPPTTGNCPKELDPGAIVYMNNKFYIPGRPGLDSTVRVKGDPKFCFLIHGVNVNDCHLEGWPKRTACEIELIGGCPVWQYIVNDSDKPAKCSDDQNTSPISCDHFGNPIYRDDPKTPTFGNTVETLVGFEGQPQECGLQRDQFGPMAGYFTIAHGKGFVRACKPDNTGCGPWIGFEH